MKWWRRRQPWLWRCFKTVYPKFLQNRLQGGTITDLSTANIKVLAVDLGAYTYSATHQYLSDIPSGARIASSANLGSKTFTDGNFDFADPSIKFGASPPSIEALVIYVDTGVAGTSELIYYTEDETGLPFTPGSSHTVTWQVATNGPFQL